MRTPRIRFGRRSLVIGVVVVALGIGWLGNRYGTGGGSDTLHPSTGAPATVSAPASAEQTPDTPGTSPAPAGDQPGPAAPTASTTGPAGDDGVHVDPPAPAATGVDQATSAAVDFLAAWLNTGNKTPQQWQDGFADKVTDRLGGLLANADPQTVPIGVAAEPAAATVTGDQLVEVKIPVVHDEKPAGVAAVTMTSASGRWLASELSWNGQ